MSMAVKVARANFQGDPGLFGFIGDAVRKATGVVGGLGIPVVSGVANTINRVTGGGTPRSRVTAPPPPSFNLPGGIQVPSIIPPRRPITAGGTISGGGTRTTTGVTLPGGILIGRRQETVGGRAAAGLGLGPSQLPAVQQQQAMMQLNGNGVPKGMRLNKTSYFLRDGTFVPAGTRLVKIRRRNPGNSRANSRAIARITSAKRMAKQLSGITIRSTKCNR